MNALSEWGFNRLAAALVIAAGFIVYANTLDGDWVWDDASSVLLHKHVQQPAASAASWQSGEIATGQLASELVSGFAQLYREDQHAFGRGQGNFYRPLLSTTFAVDYILSSEPRLFLPPVPGSAIPEPGVFWFHLQSIAWHVAAAVALLLVLARIDAPRMVKVAVPMLWVLHPLHTEAVAYISGRADMMSGTFLFLGLWLGLRNEGNKRDYLAWLGAALCYVLGLLSKEATLILPFVLALALLVRHFGQPREAGQRAVVSRSLLPLLPSLVVLATYIGLRATVLSFSEGGGGGPVTPFLERLYETVQSFGLYVAMLFLPTGLHMERTLDGVGILAAAGGSLALVLLVVAAVLAYRKGVWRLTLGVGLFLLCWLPISGLFPLNAPLAEHWMYVPMAGFWLALAELLQRGPRPLQATGLAVALALVLLFAGLTARRNVDWDNNTQLFQATLAENPRTMRVNYNLAVTMGDIDGNTSGALRHYAEVVELGAGGEDALDAAASRSGILLDSAKPLAALESYSKAATLISAASPGWVHAELTMGIMRGLFGLGRFTEALQPDKIAAIANTLNAAGVLQESAPVAAAMESFASGAPLSEKLHVPGLVGALR